MNKGISPQNDSAKEPDHTPREAAATVKPTPEDSAESHTPGGKRIPWWARWRSWKEVLEGIGIVAAILYACITYFQWRDLRHNFEAGERAWVKLGYIWPPLTSDQIATMNGDLVNIGKSPITFLYAEGAFEIVDATNPPSLSIHRARSTHGEAPFFPSDHSQFPILLFDQTTKKPRSFTADEINGLRNGTLYAAVYGMIIYRDQFSAHWYRFCSWNPGYGVAGTANAGDCVNWNVAGDGKPNVPIFK
jgi:hypothetical protein